MSSDSGSCTLDYTVFDKPSLVTKGGHDTRFTYGPVRSCFKRVDDNGKSTVIILQIGIFERSLRTLNQIMLFILPNMIPSLVEYEVKIWIGLKHIEIG
ncbi:hypothetical protein [Microbulbifer sp. JMSA002]|uniref:hypothetical protein n=1 Tax=Microbulbifer sp. JMSA002 TaxID=3243368 RepID=UPI00403A4E2D